MSSTEDRLVYDRTRSFLIQHGLFEAANQYLQPVTTLEDLS